MRNLSLYCLAATGLASIALATARPAQAAPVPQIINQAAGSYQDPIDQDRPFVVYSEPITIGMQEVAGLTITPTGITRQDSSLNGGAVGSIVKDDVLLYSFEIQNIGSDTTKVFVPNLAQISPIGVFQKVQYFDGTTWNDVSTAGYTSNALSPSGKIQVRVVVQATSGLGDMSVTLGKTGNNTPENTQNQLRSDNPEDIYTIDLADGTPIEYDGLPSNGTREAQARQSIKVGTTPEALAKIELTTEPFNQSDNTINFGLKLTLADIALSPLNGVSPTDLTGANITLDGQPRNGILIADAIPLGTKLVNATAPDNNWVPIYYYSSTPIGPNDRLDQASWSTTPPNSTNAVDIKRVGFFRADYRMPKGTSATGFQVKVQVTDFSRSEIYNIAQVLGTQPNDPNSPADIVPSTKLIFDESGDNLPNNYNDDGTPHKDANQQPILFPGIIDSNAPASDPRSPRTVGQAAGSTATGDGEYLLVSFQAKPPSLLNGPREEPSAIGPTDNQDDFTNKSAPIPSGEAKFDPSSVSFTNTVLNTSTLPVDIKILPTVSSATDLPNGTVVTLEDPGDSSKITAFSFQNGIFTPLTNNPATLLLKNVRIGVANKKNYTVRIDLPKDTPNTVKAYPVKLIAFVDTNDNNILDTAETGNDTIDRVYTGFIQVIKESRLLNDKREPLPDSDPNFCKDRSIVATATNTVIGEPGQYIEYCIRYKNISEPATGIGNKVLTATGFTITEDGNPANDPKKPNNWGSRTIDDPGTAVDSGGVVSYDVTTEIYKDKINSLIKPGDSGEFRFRRKVK
jgi:hypothetical protein